MNELPSARPQGHGAATTLEAFRLLTRRPDYSHLKGSWAPSLSLGKTNYVLHALLDKELVKIENFSRSYIKFVYTYLLTLSGLAAKYHRMYEHLKLISANSRHCVTRSMPLAGGMWATATDLGGIRRIPDRCDFHRSPARHENLLPSR
jgi:hypothetical protein